jgi:pyruvate formate lyase activating enzyme
MIKGTIFDIKKYAIHDGPGIRTTVFFKGCPLRCRWCHNPEGQSSRPEMFVRSSRCLKECSECLSVCELKAISRTEMSPVIDRERCNSCGKCAEVCPAEAIEVVGRQMSVQEVMAEVEKDMIFHDESGGGVTFSGGEPLLQPVFLSTLLEKSKEKDIHKTVDTSGYASFEILEEISKNVDLFLYDLKMMDEKKHKEYTGKSNKVILENLKKLLKKAKKVVVRIPLIPGINDDEKNIQETAEFVCSLKRVQQISLLPYHNLGEGKYKRLERSYIQNVPLPSKELLEKVKKKLTDYGFDIRTGD